MNSFYSDEDTGYIAEIPDLEACPALGKTAEEALRHMEIAKNAWLKAARAEGKPIPETKYRSAICQVTH